MDFDYSGLYVCDPQKNTLCNKRNCGTPCTMTSHKEFAKDGGTDMNVQRAIEILNPAHREHYESIEPVNEACRMGIAALSYRVRKKPEYLPARPAPALACKRCGSVKHLHNADGAQNAFCGQCGQAIDWTEPEVHCGDCEHLTFSDCYGECGKGYKGIVQPGDSCGKGEHK